MPVPIERGAEDLALLPGLALRLTSPPPAGNVCAIEQRATALIALRAGSDQ
jgi:hypothetical protein